MTATHTVGPPQGGLRRIADLPGPRGWPAGGQPVPAAARRDPPGRRALVRAVRRAVQVSHRASASSWWCPTMRLIAEVLRDRPQGWRRTQQLAGGVARDGAQARVVRRRGRGLARAAPHGDERARSVARARVLSATAARDRSAAPPLASRPRTKGARCNLQPELMRYTVDTVAGLAFGRDINTLESDGDVIQQHLDRIFPALFRRLMAPLPYWRWFKLPADRALDRSVAEVKRAIAEFVAEARERLQRRPGAPRAAAEPARGDDRRRRRGPHRHRRRAGVGQRADHAAGRRGHHGQHAGVAAAPAASPPRRDGAGARRGACAVRRQGRAADAGGPGAAWSTSRPACTRRCA